MADQKDKLWTCISCGNENPLEGWSWACQSCGKANWKDIRSGLFFICVIVSIAGILLAIAMIFFGGWQAFNQKGIGLLLTIVLFVIGFIAVLNLGLFLAKLDMTFRQSRLKPIVVRVEGLLCGGLMVSAGYIVQVGLLQATHDILGEGDLSGIVMAAVLSVTGLIMLGGVIIGLLQFITGKDLVFAIYTSGKKLSSKNDSSAQEGATQSDEEPGRES